MLGLLKGICWTGSVVAFGAVASGGIVSILPQAQKMLENLNTPTIQEANKETEQEQENIIPDPLLTVPTQEEVYESDQPDQTQIEGPQTNVPDRGEQQETYVAENTEQVHQELLLEQKAKQEKQAKKQEFQQKIQEFQTQISAINNLIQTKKGLVDSSKKTLESNTTALNALQEQKTQKTRELTQASEAKTLVTKDLKDATEKEAALKALLTSIGVTETDIQEFLEGKDLTLENLKLAADNLKR